MGKAKYFTFCKFAVLKCIKITLLGNLEIYKTMSQLIRIKDPDKLPVVTDDLIIYEKAATKCAYGYQENLDEYLYSEILHKLPDSLQLKLRSIRKEIQDFNNREDLDFDKRIVFEKQYHAFLIKLSYTIFHFKDELLILITAYDYAKYDISVIYSYSQISFT